jgi:hypothetical protein
VVVTVAALVSVMTLATQAQAFGRKNPMDLNNDGKVVLAELRQIRETIFAKSDTNQDGLLDRGEFSRIQSNMPSGRRGGARF